MAIQTYLIELQFDQETASAIDHEAIVKNISGMIHHLNSRGVFACLCEPPTLVGVVSVKALTQQYAAGEQLTLLTPL